MCKIEQRIEGSFGGEPLDERTAMLAEREAGLQRHAARLVDVGIDRDIVAAGKFHRARHEGAGATLRRRGTQRPMHARARWRGEARALEVREQVELTLRLGRAR